MDAIIFRIRDGAVVCFMILFMEVLASTAFSLLGFVDMATITSPTYLRWTFIISFLLGALAAAHQPTARAFFGAIDALGGGNPPEE
jgi:hypothetical protein